MASKKRSQSRRAKTRAKIRARRKQASPQEAGVLHEAVKNHANHSLLDILQNPASLARQRDSDGHIPLHYACSRRAPLELVQHLVERYPHGLQVQNDYQALPLHYCCDRGVNVPVLQFVVNAYPPALDQKAFFGNLPIHLLVANEEASMDAIRFVVEQYPRGLQIANADGMLPLQHCWMRQGVEGRLDVYRERLVYLAEQYPEALLHKWQCGTSEKQTMLHNELSFRSRNGGPLDGLRFLLQELYFPANHKQYAVKPEICRFALGSRFRGGRHRQEELLRVLLEGIPKDAVRKGSLATLTESALQCASSLAVMECIIAACPEELQMCDKLGRSILAWNIWTNSLSSTVNSVSARMEQKAVLELLLRKCNDNVTCMADNQGRIPLHWALGWNAPLNIFAELLERNPRGIFQADGHGYFPIHFAALRYKSVEGVYLLLKNDPSQLTRCVFPKNECFCKEPRIKGNFDLSFVY